MQAAQSEFAGKAAIVTGASSGIGADVARLLVKQGAQVLGVGRNEARLAALKEELGEAFVPHVADMAELAQVEGMIQAAIDRFGGLDILINNAGIAGMGDAASTDPSTWRHTMAVDLDAVFFASRAALPALIQSRGCIVNNASLSGMAADYGLTAYCVAKAGVIELTRCMAIDYAATGIRVNAVSPGATVTPQNSSAPAALAEAYAQAIPMQRMGRSEEIADAILYLASARASFITGQNLLVDGGISAHTGQPNIPALFSKLRG